MEPKNAEELWRALIDSRPLKKGETGIVYIKNTLNERLALIDEYASLREKETAIEFIKWYDANDGVDWIDDSEYLEWYTEYTKHKEG